MATSTAIACLAPGPIGTAWRRTSSGESTTSTSGSAEPLVEGLPGPLQQQRIAGGQHGLVRALILVVALHGQDHEVAAGRDHAREHGLADQGRARRDHDLGEARSGG